MLVLAQARVAAQQENWSAINQYLQQFSSKLTQEISSSDLDSIIDLALLVLINGDFQDRWDVAKIVPKLGEKVIPKLIEILEDEEVPEELRWFSGRILGEFDHPHVVLSLVELLKTSEDDDLAEMAVQALSNLGYSAIHSLTDLLTQEETKVLATKALGLIHTLETIDPLLSVVRDEDVAVRLVAIETLSSFSDVRIFSVLLEALKDTSAKVRKEAVIGLGLVGLRQQKIAIDFDSNLVSQLKPLLYDFNLEVCQQCAIALSRIGTDEAATALFEVLKSKATPVSLQVDLVRSLGWMQSNLALDCVEAKLTDSSLEVCQEIIKALGRVEAELKPKAAKILIDFLNSSSPLAKEATTKQSLAVSLGQLGVSSAIPTLNELSRDTEKGVKLHAIAALKQLQN